MPTNRYGLHWPDIYKDLDIELISFREGTADKGGDPDNRPQHFKNIVRHYWGPKSKMPFVWNPWNERMLQVLCDHNWVALSGCASSGKTRTAAMWGIVNWLAWPQKTIVLFTSTSLTDSRKRIWGAVEELFLSATDKEGRSLLPGKLTSSTGKIRTTDGQKIWPDSVAGIYLMPGDRAKEKENIGKLIGIHTERVVFLCDEMPELSPALTEAAESNLVVNPHFQFVGIGNFASIYDPFGTFATPKAGWGSVSPENDEWETKKGVCLRFDGLKSPNVLLGEEKYAGIYSTRHYKEQCDGPGGENSARFWRMCRSFPCPEADANRIYSEADLLRGKVHDTVRWQQTPLRGAALDPAFATGGDRAMMYVGDMGTSTEGRQTLQVTHRLELREDVRKKQESRSLQIARQYKAKCEELGIPPERAAYDGTGGGMPFGALLAEVWSPKVVAIQFGGAASERVVGVKDRRPGNKAFTNRVTELWFSGVEYVQSEQIKGLPGEAARDWTERRYDTVKGGDGLRMRAEKKEEMKQRIGRSPDDGDAAMILLALFRERFGFVPTGMEGKRMSVQDSWKKRALLANRIYAHANYEAEAA